MNEHIKAFSGNKRRGVVIDELLLATVRIDAEIVTGAINEPKIPPLVGD